MNDVKALFIGKPALFKEGLMSAFVKNGQQEIHVFKDRVEGDQVFNQKFHGGPDRVLHQFPLEHYALLKENFPQARDLFVAGSFAENMAVSDLNERNICLGDVIKMGSVLAQVTEPRNPCGFIDLQYGQKGVMAFLQSELKTGWFYRVLEAGKIKVGDKLEIIDRPHPDLSVATVFSAFKVEKGADAPLVKRISELPELSERYRIFGQKLVKASLKR